MKKLIFLLLLTVMTNTISAQFKKSNNNLRITSLGSRETYSYEYEPKEKSTFNWKYTYLNTIYYDDGYADGTCDIYDIYLEGNGFVSNIYVLLPLESPEELPLGTYEFRLGHLHGSALSSEGGNDDYDLPSYVGTDIADVEEGTYYTSYFIVGGTITVAIENGDTVMDVRAKTYNGSTIIINSSGEVSTNADVVGSGTTKVYTHEGVLCITGIETKRDIGVYNAQGVELKHIYTDIDTEIHGLPRGEVLIVRCGDTATKVVL